MNGSKDLKTIIYFKGVYDTLDLFTDHLIEAFESMGYGTFVYHTANEEVCKKMLLRLLDESQEFAVVTFNNLGYNLSFEQSEAAEDEEKKPEEHNIWNYFHIPYIDILMDHPFHYEKPLCNMPETAVILCTDRNHVKYIRRFFKNNVCFCVSLHSDIDTLHDNIVGANGSFSKTSIGQISFHMQEWNWDISINL